MADANPFDAFDDPDYSDPNALKPGPKPGYLESFAINAREGFKSTLLPVARDLADARVVERSKRVGVAQPGDSPFDGKPTQQEVDDAQFRLNTRKREKEEYRAFESDGIIGKSIGLLGGFAGGIAAPENLLSAGGAVASRVASGAARLGTSAAVGRIVGSGIEAGAVNAAIDVPTQAMEVAAGLEDAYSGARTFAAFGIGAITGGGMQGIADWVARRRAQAVADAVVADRPAQTAPAPAAPTGEAPRPANPFDDYEVPSGRIDAPKVGGPPAARFGGQGPAVRLTRPDDPALSAMETQWGFLRGVKEEPDGITAWHGSPHDFDRFSLDKVGTGEGAQVYGRGLYFAENRVVGDTYRLNLAKRTDEWRAARGKFEQAKDEFERSSKYYLDTGEQKFLDAANEAERVMKEAKARVDAASGSLYEVRIAAKPDQMLDWDAPVSAQSDFVKAALAKLGIDIKKYPEGTPGQSVYDEIAGIDLRTLKDKHPEQAASALRKAGIVGIRYLDGNSRGAGDGTRNYVVFDDNLISIVSKNGEHIKGAEAVKFLNMRGDAQARFGSALNDVVSPPRAENPPAAVPGDLPAARPDVPVDAGGLRADGRVDGGGIAPATKPVAAPEMPRGSGDVSVPRAGVLADHRVVAADGKPVDVSPKVVELADLITSDMPGFDPALQPRDRSRIASQAQIQEIAGRLDPERLGLSSEADRGSPIIGPDRMVESGNGRVMAIAQAYAQNGDAAARYRAWLEAQGIDTAGMKAPVLVRERMTPMTPEERAAFTLAANRATTLAMSAVERAVGDARSLTPEMFGLLRNADDLGAAGNRDFIKAFVGTLPATERGALITPDGSISSEGITRVRNAVMAAAYGDSPVLARIAEAADDDAKSLSKALLSVAPEWASLKADIAAGRVPREFDLTRELMEAVTRTTDIRAKGVKLDNFLKQLDAFDQLDTNVERFMRMFYHPNQKRAAGTDRIADAVRYYAQEARKVSTDPGLDLGIAPVRPGDLTAAALARGTPDATAQPNLFGGGPGDGAGSQALGREIQGRGFEGGRGAPGSEGVVGSPAGPRQRIASRIEEFRRQIDPNIEAARIALPPRAGPDAQLPQRGQLPGEANKPKVLPADATPDEIRSFNIHSEIEKIATLLGRKVEIDRFITPGTLGTHHRKTGVLRLRFQGDFEVFAHEFSHVADLRLHSGPNGTAWKALLAQYDGEVRPLDLNNSANPAKQTLTEGVAEFGRMYVNNPAYARQRAPNFFDEFERFLATRDPELLAIYKQASRVSQVDSGMDPMQGMASVISSALEQKGLRKFASEAKEIGGGVRGYARTFGEYVRWAYVKLVGDHAIVDRAIVDPLRAAHFEKTGKPLEFGWQNPSSIWKRMKGAEQTAIDAFYNGPRNHDPGRGTLPDTIGPGLYDPLVRAMDGEAWRIQTPGDPKFNDFNAYLVARRARAEYVRWRQGEIQKPPIGRSENDVNAAIPAFEARYPSFKVAADGVFAWNRAQLEREFNAGLWPKEVYEAIVAGNPDYVPFLRDMRADKAGGPKAGGGKLETGIAKRFGGSSRNILSPVEMMLFRAMKTEKLIAENDFWVAVSRFAKSGGEFAGRIAEDLPNSKVVGQSVDAYAMLRQVMDQKGMSKVDIQSIMTLLENMIGPDGTTTLFKRTEIGPDGERIVFRWEEGKRIPMKLGTDDWSMKMFDVYSDMSGPEKDVMLRTLWAFNAKFSQFITNVPSFALINILSDAVTRTFQAQNISMMGRTPLAAHFAGLGLDIAARFDSNNFAAEFVRSYNAMGGIRGGVVSSMARELSARTSFASATKPLRTFGEIGRDFAKEVGESLVNPRKLAWEVITSPKHVIDAVVKMVEGTETVGRHGQAYLVYRHLKRQGLDDVTAMRMAFDEARAVMDNDRRGEAIRHMNRLAVFTNPAVQGTDRTYTAMFEPFAKAAMQARERGGWDRLDGDVKAAFNDAMKNVGALAAVASASVGYYFFVADDPIYQAQTDYMKRRYWIIPTVDGNGKQKIWTIPKPFDFPGAMMSTIEMGLDGMRRNDPDVWAKMAKTFMNAAVPRQFGVSEIATGDPLGALYEMLVGSVPLVKLGAEVKSGVRFGFEGGESFDIVPDHMKAKLPRDQWNQYSTWLAKKIGKAFDVSPMKVDHVLNGLGATLYKDASAVLDGLVGKNPNKTLADGLNQAFFGRIYRDAGTAGLTSPLYAAMGRTNGKYSTLANSYRQALELGRPDDADGYYRSASDIGKTLMTMKAYARFNTRQQQLHPLVRTETIVAEFRPILTQLAEYERFAGVVVKQSYRRGEERKTLNVEPKQAAAITATMRRWIAEEIRNGLSVAGEPGFATFPVIDTSRNIDAVRAVSPEIADEIEKRFRRRGILPITHVERQWPEVKRRLLADKDKASLGDLRLQ